MFVIGNLFIALARMLDMALSVVWWLIIIRAIISWVNPDPFNRIVQFLYRTTEPILSPIRRVLPMMAIDISPIIAFLLIILIRSWLVATLFDLGMRLR